MASSLPWTPPKANDLDLMTTIIILEFASFLDSDGRPLGEAAVVLEQVLSSFSELSAWKSTRWGPRSDHKHGIIIIIVWNSLLPPDNSPFLRKGTLPQSSLLQPLAFFLTSEPRVLNIPLHPALQPPDYQLRDGTFELELLHLPHNTRLLNDRAFSALFCAMTPFVESEDNRIDSTPSDFKSGHRGWLLDDQSIEPALVNAILLHYSSLEAERRFKDTTVPHNGMLRYQDHPESLYQRKFIDVLAGLAEYGVQRESFHFRLKRWEPDPIPSVPRRTTCCTIQ
ncbi:MAG: hypothetical protein Q9223_003935 [Gallowayella weberi]